MVRAMVPHLVTRIVYTGSGKVGAETGSARSRGAGFQLSQRAEFFEEVVGLETTLKRPIVNTRDEPHGDPRRYRRLHVIIGDANMSQVATFLKLGTTALLLGALEDQGIGGVPRVARRSGAHDPRDLLRPRPERQVRARRRRPQQRARRPVPALRARRALRRRRAAATCVGGDDEASAILGRWSRRSPRCGATPEDLATSVDWIAKRRLVDGYRARHGLASDDPRLQALDLQYHDLRPERSLALRAGLEVLVDARRRRSRRSPSRRLTPARTSEGAACAKFPDEIVTANWDSLVFDLGTDPLRRVPMMDPLRGTAAHTAALLARCDTAAQLLDELGS